MTQIAIYVAVIAIVISCLSIFGKLFLNPGKKLNQKFVSMGNLIGKDKQTIISKVGQGPNIITNNSDLTNDCTWKIDWYSITLRFDNTQKCIGIVSQKLK
jgi:hypothetical protein